MTTQPSSLSSQPTASAQPRPPAPAPGSWGAGRIIVVIIGCLLLVGGLAMGTAGAVVVIANSTHRDADGYLMSSPVGVSTSGYALTSANLRIQSAVDLPHQILGDAKVTVTPRGGAPVFVGVARTSEVAGYLTSVQRTEVTAFGESPVYRQLGGGAPSTPPTSLPFWVARSTGTGPQTLTWPVQNGDWTVVMMNADGSSGVAGDVATGATVPAIEWIYDGLFVGALAFLVIGVVLVVVAVRRAGSPA